MLQRQQVIYIFMRFRQEKVIIFQYTVFFIFFPFLFCVIFFIGYFSKEEHMFHRHQVIYSEEVPIGTNHDISVRRNHMFHSNQGLYSEEVPIEMNHDILVLMIHMFYRHQGIYSEEDPIGTKFDILVRRNICFIGTRGNTLKRFR